MRNDEIHIRLFSLHLYLLNEKLRLVMRHTPSLTTAPSEYLDYKKSVLLINSRKFPKSFLYHAYASFHSHLPEELFFDDFATFFSKANSQTYRAF